MIARRLRISGRVQGVGYRDWLVDEARGAGLSGWVRNRSDGTVEALLAGEAAAVAAVTAACRHGPRLAAVSAIEETEANPPPQPGFHCHPSA